MREITSVWYQANSTNTNITSRGGFIKVPTDEEEERMRKAAEESQKRWNEARKKAAEDSQKQSRAGGGS